MAKLKGVEVVEIKRLLYKGEEYSYVEDMPEIGDIIRVDGSWTFLKDGDMFICAELDASGDAVSSKGHCHYREHYDVFRKVSTSSIGGIKTEKRRAKPGDSILITDATCTSGYYENDDILTVKRTSIFNGVEVEEFNGTYIYHNEYEVIVENNSEKIESISVGDYVKVVGDTYWNDLKPGEYVKVIGERDSDGDYAIERLDGSDCDYAQESSLERVELTDNDIVLLKLGRKIDEYKAGDIVRVIGDNADGSRNMDGDIGIVENGLLRVAVPARSHITHRNCYHSAESLELISPVENRVDKAAS